MARAGAKNVLDGGAGAKILDCWAGAEIWFPVSSEISDFTPCTHAQSNILHTKHADKTDY